MVNGNINIAQSWVSWTIYLLHNGHAMVTIIMVIYSIVEWSTFTIIHLSAQRLFLNNQQTLKSSTFLNTTINNKRGSYLYLKSLSLFRLTLLNTSKLLELFSRCNETELQKLARNVDKVCRIMSSNSTLDAIIEWYSYLFRRVTRCTAKQNYRKSCT